MERNELDLKGNAIGIMMTMAEGNPGGMNILSRLNIKHILDLDDMNIRGSQIWVGYKDHCGQDIEKFIKALDSRDASMVDTINKEGLEHKAVQYGASGGNRELL